MQSPHISIVTILLLSVICYPAPSFGFDVGLKAAEDVVFLNITEMFEKESGRPTYFVKTYSDNMKEPYEITNIKVTPKGRYGLAYAGVVAGGPGHTFVSIGYAMPNNLMPYAFDVMVYKRIIV